MTDPVWDLVNAAAWEFDLDVSRTPGIVAGLGAIPDDNQPGGYRVFVLGVPGLADEVMQRLDERVRHHLYRLYTVGPAAAGMKPFTTPDGVDGYGFDMFIVHDDEFEVPDTIPDDWTA